jgi:hypothetical protein
LDEKANKKRNEGENKRIIRIYYLSFLFPALPSPLSATLFSLSALDGGLEIDGVKLIL